jgi:hypothetical protein
MFTNIIKVISMPSLAKILKQVESTLQQLPTIPDRYHPSDSNAYYQRRLIRIIEENIDDNPQFLPLEQVNNTPLFISIIAALNHSNNPRDRAKLFLVKYFLNYDHENFEIHYLIHKVSRIGCVLIRINLPEYDIWINPNDNKIYNFLTLAEFDCLHFERYFNLTFELSQLQTFYTDANEILVTAQTILNREKRISRQLSPDNTYRRRPQLFQEIINLDLSWRKLTGELNLILNVFLNILAKDTTNRLATEVLKLERIDLSYTQLNTEDIRSLISFLSQYPYVKVLDLSGNKIFNKESQSVFRIETLLESVLSPDYSGLQQLEYLSFNDIDFCDKDSKALIDFTQESNSTLTSAQFGAKYKDDFKVATHHANARRDLIREQSLDKSPKFYIIEKLLSGPLVNQTSLHSLIPSINNDIFMAFYPEECMLPVINHQVTQYSVRGSRGNSSAFLRRLIYETFNIIKFLEEQQVVDSTDYRREMHEIFSKLAFFMNTLSSIALPTLFETEYSLLEKWLHFCLRINNYTPPDTHNDILNYSIIEDSRFEIFKGPGYRMVQSHLFQATGREYFQPSHNSVANGSELTNIVLVSLVVVHVAGLPVHHVFEFVDRIVMLVNSHLTNKQKNQNVRLSFVDDFNEKIIASLRKIFLVYLDPILRLKDQAIHRFSEICTSQILHYLDIGLLRRPKNTYPEHYSVNQFVHLVLQYLMYLPIKNANELLPLKGGGFVTAAGILNRCALRCYINKKDSLFEFHKTKVKVKDSHKQMFDSRTSFNYRPSFVNGYRWMTEHEIGYFNALRNENGEVLAIPIGNDENFNRTVGTVEYKLPIAVLSEIQCNNLSFSTDICRTPTHLNFKASKQITLKPFSHTSFRLTLFREPHKTSPYANKNLKLGVIAKAEAENYIRRYSI